MNDKVTCSSTSKLLLILLCLSASALEGLCQVQEEIEVVKSYKPELTDAVKMDVQPEDPELNLQSPDITYKPEPVYMQLSPSKTQLPGVSLGQQQLDPLRHSHFKIGGGNYANFIAEGTYNTKRNKDQVLSAFARHHSGKGPVNNSDFSEQILRLKGKQLFDNVTLKARPFFRRNRYHRYGFSGDSISQSDVQQDYLRYGLETTLHNKRADSGAINYKIQVKGQDLQASNNFGETDAAFEGYLEETFRGNNAARIDAKYRFLDYRSNGDNFQRSIIKFGGRYIINNEYGKIELGFRTASVVDSTDEPFRFYPNLKVTYPMIPEKLTLFGGIKGALEPNTYAGLSNENPYLRSDVNLRNTNKQFDIFAGAKGNLNQALKYVASISYQNIEEMPLYVNTRQRQRRFRMQYDNAIATVFKIHTEATYQPADHFQLGLKLNYRDFTMGDQDRPWHRPNLDYRLTGRYNFGEKIRLRASVQGFSSREVLTYNPDGTQGTNSLDPIIDLNTGVDYRFSKTFTAFFNFKNLLGNEYQYWNQYPVRGFHLTGGLKMNVFE